MSEAVLLAVPRPFQYKGKRYFVAVRDFMTELAFADWVMADAGLALARMRPRWPADFYAEQMRIFNGKIAGKQFRWNTQDVHDASWTDDGRRQLLYLKMKRGEENGGEPVDRSLLDTIASDTDKNGFSAKYDELLRIMMEQDYPFLLDQGAERTTAPENLSHLAKPPSQPATDTTRKA